jgi:hypothetical protein
VINLMAKGVFSRTALNLVHSYSTEAKNIKNLSLLIRFFFYLNVSFEMRHSLLIEQNSVHFSNLMEKGVEDAI